MTCKLDAEARGFTHQKRPYCANAVQFTNTNTEHILTILNQNAEALKYGPTEIMIRFAEPMQGRKLIDVIKHGDWVVTGENGNIKIYTNESFYIKYEKFNEGTL